MNVTILTLCFQPNNELQVLVIPNSLLFVSLASCLSTHCSFNLKCSSLAGTSLSTELPFTGTLPSYMCTWT